MTTTIRALGTIVLATATACANAVAMALEQRGIPGTRLQTRGLGESEPVASNETTAGRQQNRRVEVIVSD